MKKLSFKKILVIAIALFAILVIASILLVPAFINSERLQSTLENNINSKINGNFSVSNLKVKLRHKLIIDLNEIKISDENDMKIASSKHSQIEVGLLQLLKSDPTVRLTLEQPDIFISQDSDKKLNIQKLLKKESAVKSSTDQNLKDKATTIENTETKQDEKSTIDKKTVVKAKVEKSKNWIENKIDRTKVSFKIEQANLEYKDFAKNKFNIKGLDLSLINATKEGFDSLRVEAPIKYTDSASKSFSTKILSNTKCSKSKGDGLSCLVKVDLDNINNTLVSALKEKLSDTIKIEIPITLNDNSPTIGDSSIDISGQKIFLHNINLADSKTRLNIKTNQFEIKKINSFLKDRVAEGGAFSIDLNVEKNELKTLLNGAIDVNNIKLNIEKLNKPLLVNSKLNFNDETLRLTNTRLESDDNIFDISGQIMSIFKDQDIDLQVASDSVNTLTLLKKEPANKAQLKTTAAITPKSAPKNSDPKLKSNKTNITKNKQASKTPLDLSSLAKKKVTVSFDIKKLVHEEMSFNNFNSKLNIRNNELNFDMSKLQTLNGNIKLSVKADTIKNSKYSYKVNISNIDTKMAADTFAKTFRNTADGILTTSISGNGQYTGSAAMASQTISGNFKLKDAVLKTIDIYTAGTDSITKGIESISKIAPNAALKILDKSKNTKGKYESISSDYTLKNGVLEMPNFKIVSIKNKGIDAAGRTQINLINKKLDASWMMQDKYDQLKLKDQKIKGLSVLKLLSNKDGFVELPLKIGCTLSKPCYKLSTTTKGIRDTLKKNLTSTAKEKIKEEAVYKAKKEIKKLEEKYGDEIKNKLKDKLKKFGF